MNEVLLWALAIVGVITLLGLLMSLLNYMFR
jgi:hypothetical protein